MKKKKLAGALPVLTKGKLIRLLLFIIVTAIGFTLKKYVAGFNTFGWGFTFGMVDMAILTG